MRANNVRGMEFVYDHLLTIAERGKSDPVSDVASSVLHSKKRGAGAFFCSNDCEMTALFYPPSPQSWWVTQVPGPVPGAAASNARV
ncbi:hypothetical protein So717_35530 [Roseobacter cerasinus]|uniref:Uncharacterized protein n=1 Tax=Roseobacter cerasinus TaxID=2602289 RepID=A0A640VWP2_9RHOB|nr:hypothetical protein So717_35530 [Roseobacter cerasinus]